MDDRHFELHAEIEDGHWWFTGRRHIMRRLVETLLPPCRTSRLVDVGCGTGANIAAFSADYGCLGVDVSPCAIDRARRRFPETEFVCGTAPQDVADEFRRARLVSLMDVLEHVPDDFELLSSLLAASRPGTYFLITVPADPALWSRHDVSFGHYRRYDRGRLERTWQGLPVACLLHSPFNSRLWPAVRLLRVWNRRRDRTWGRAGTDLGRPNALFNRLLHRIFAGEAGPLCGALRNGSGAAFRRGVSLVAVLRREPGDIAVRRRPPDVPADAADPAAGRPCREPACPAAADR